MIWFREFRQNFELTDHFEEFGGRYDIIHITPSRRVFPGIFPNPFIVTKPAIQNQHTRAFTQVDKFTAMSIYNRFVFRVPD